MTCQEHLALTRGKSPSECTHAEFVAIMNHAVNCGQCYRRMVEASQRTKKRLSAEELEAMVAEGRRLALRHFYMDDPEAPVEGGP